MPIAVRSIRGLVCPIGMRLSTNTVSAWESLRVAFSGSMGQLARMICAGHLVGPVIDLCMPEKGPPSHLLARSGKGLGARASDNSDQPGDAEPPLDGPELD